MIRSILLFLALGVYQSANCQSYDEVITSCRAAYMNSMSLPLDQLELVYDSAAEKLCECLLGTTFRSFNVVDLNGQQYYSKDMKGKVVLLNFWFTTCPPCVTEIPVFNELKMEFKEEDFMILSFASNDREAMLDFMKEKIVDYPVIIDARELIEKEFKMTFGYPTTILLDRDSEIVDFKNGGVLDADRLQIMKEHYASMIREHLDKRANAK